MVDEQGRPLVVYHGTFSDFTRFSDRRLGENTDGNASSESYAQTAYVGFWFNTKPMGGRAGYTLDMPVYLSIKKPHREMSLDWLAQGLESTKGRTYRRELMREGYDGIVLPDEEFGGQSWVAFRPEQIKSAIGNNGDFSKDSPVITKSESSRVLFVKSHVSAYTKKDGTFVAAHDDKRVAHDPMSSSRFQVARGPTGAGMVTGDEGVMYFVKPEGDGVKLVHRPVDHKSKVKEFEVFAASVDDAVSQADKRLRRSYASLKGTAKYARIPPTWDGDAKKAAKALIDAGYAISFGQSTQSRSKYIIVETESGDIKVRLSDHDLPSSYDQPDVDFRYGGDIKELVNSVSEKAGGAMAKSDAVHILFIKAKHRGDDRTIDMFGTHLETRTRKDGHVQKYHVANAKKDAALDAAISHLKEDAKQTDMPAHERKEDKALVAKLEEARGGTGNDTAARRKAALAVLGGDWRSTPDGKKDAYKRSVKLADGGRYEVMIRPARTVAGNFYVGSYFHGGKRSGPGNAVDHPKTLEEAKAVADGWIAGVAATKVAKVEPAKPDPETELRALWTKQGVSKERQDELIRQIGEKAKPGADVGPFKIAPLKRDEVTAEKLKQLIGNNLGLHEFPVEGGAKVKAEVKITTRGGVIRTKYLHITTVEPSGKWEYYREQPNGAFKLVSSGRGADPRVSQTSGGSAAITVTSKKRVKDPLEGTQTYVTLSNGKTHRIQRLNATESMGLPGWHDVDGGYLADTEQGAIDELVRRAGESATKMAKSLSYNAPRVASVHRVR